MNHQDWDPVVLRKKFDDVDKKKKISQLQPTHLRDLKADDPEVYKLKTFETDYIKQIIAKRLETTLTQKDLAKRMNVDIGTIQRFEQGKLPYDSSLKSKINKALQ